MMTRETLSEIRQAYKTMTQDNPHNEMPKDIVEERVTTIMYNLAKCCTLSPQDCDLMIEGLTRELTTAHKKGVEVGREEAVQELYALNPISHTENYALYKGIPLPEVSL